MVSKPSTELSSWLINQIKSLELTRKRMENLHSNGTIFRRDLEHVYEGIFLKAVTSFESFLENLFIGLLYEKYKLSSRKNVKRVNFINRKITVEIILSGKSYVDWLPYNNVEDRAEIFF